MHPPIDPLRVMSQRRFLHTTVGGVLAIAAVTATGVSPPTSVMRGPSGPAPCSASGRLADGILQAFEADVQAAMEIFHMVGAAIAHFEGNQTVYSRGFGVRDLQSQAPVTPRTRFGMASNMKSMTSLLVATFVDEGVLDWDLRVVDIRPEFRAPTAALTRRLRRRDLPSMASGMAESPRLDFSLSAGIFSVLDLLRSIAYLSVIVPPHTKYSYNNTLFAAGGFMGPFAQKAPPETLEDAYAALMRQRVFDPIGMADAATASDLRRLGDDYATGYVLNLFGDHSPLRVISTDGTARPAQPLRA